MHCRLKDWLWIIYKLITKLYDFVWICTLSRWNHSHGVVTLHIARDGFLQADPQVDVVLSLGLNNWTGMTILRLKQHSAGHHLQHLLEQMKLSLTLLVFCPGNQSRYMNFLSLLTRYWTPSSASCITKLFWGLPSIHSSPLCPPYSLCLGQTLYRSQMV